jgi:cupin superfamily acireductone dioxygenase involved in methionine salvage
MFRNARSANGGNGRCWHETDVLCVPTNVCSWWKSGHAADIAAMTDFDAQPTWD